MNHAVFCVTPSARAISHELIPFLLFTAIHSAGSHFESGIGLSSKTVPTLAENCLSQSRHFQTRRVFRNAAFLDSHAGHIGCPSGQRNPANTVKATSGSAKYRIAPSSEVGTTSVLFMTQISTRGPVSQVYSCPC